jgi:hypothetical protein
MDCEPQRFAGAKAQCLNGACGTTKVVPCYKACSTVFTKLAHRPLQSQLIGFYKASSSAFTNLAQSLLQSQLIGCYKGCLSP